MRLLATYKLNGFQTIGMILVITDIFNINFYDSILFTRARKFYIYMFLFSDGPTNRLHV